MNNEVLLPIYHTRVIYKIFYTRRCWITMQVGHHKSHLSFGWVGEGFLFQWEQNMFQGMEI